MTNLEPAFLQLFTMIVTTVASCELLVRLPLFARGRQLFTFVRKGHHVLFSSRISDHWKERVALIYAVGLVRCTMILFLLSIAVAFPLGAGMLILSGSLNGLVETSVKPITLCVVVVASGVYLTLRRFWFGRIQPS